MPSRPVIKLDYKPRLKLKRSTRLLSGGRANRYRPEWGNPLRPSMYLLRWVTLSLLSLVTLAVGGMTANRFTEVASLWPSFAREAPSAAEHRLVPQTPQLQGLPVLVNPATGTDDLFPAPSRQPNGPVWQQVTVRKGDSLTVIFERLGLGASDLRKLLSVEAVKAALQRLFPGQRLRILIEDSKLLRLEYQQGPTRALRVVKNRRGRFVAKQAVFKPEVRVSMTTVSIGDSMFLAGHEVGLSDEVLMELVEVFRWDIDFALDIRPGDRLSVVYEELFKDDKKIGDGEVLAAEFINRGKTYRAVRYVDAQGRADYFTSDGAALNGAFLRTPLQFTRISSHFNLQRRHPVLHTIRAHRGVDYAAPRGTAVKATGSARVRFAGGQSGYGNTVILDHGDTYSTLYAHLSGFAKGIRTGQTVQQGQVVGYVGSTGLATGPHLHYEFRVKDVHKDPLTVHLPRSMPLDGKARAGFRSTAKTLLAQLDALSATHTGIARSRAPTLAMAETGAADGHRHN